MGTPLFERTTRRLALTDAGARLHGRIRNPIADLEDAYGHVRDVGRGSAGVLSFGVLLRPLPELSYRHLTDDELLFVVPDGHPLASVTPTWKSLERYPCISVGNGNTEHALAAEQVRTAAAYEVEHVATALAMVRQGLGVSVIPSSVLPSVNVEGLVCLPVRGSASIRRIGVITKKDRQLGAAARAFVGQLMEERGGPKVGQGGGTAARRVARAGRGKAG